MTSKTKTYDSFPLGNFLIGGCSKPFRLDCDSLGGGILLYVRDDVLSNLLDVKTKLIEGFYVEMNLHNDKCLINCSCSPYKNMTRNDIHVLSKKLDIYSLRYNNCIILGVFNIEMEE